MVMANEQAKRYEHGRMSVMNPYADDDPDVPIAFDEGPLTDGTLKATDEEKPGRDR
jgi:hypothetical protein